MLFWEIEYKDFLLEYTRGGNDMRLYGKIKATSASDFSG